MLKFMNIEKKVHETKHNGMNVSTYYSELKILWNELDSRSFRPNMQLAPQSLRSWLTKTGCMTFWLAWTLSMIQFESKSFVKILFALYCKLIPMFNGKKAGGMPCFASDLRVGAQWWLFLKILWKTEKSRAEDRFGDAKIVSKNLTKWHTREKYWKLYGHSTQGRGGGCSSTRKPSSYDWGFK